MFQSRPLRLYYSVFDGPEVPLPEDDFMERFTRSRDPSWPPIDQRVPASRHDLDQLPDVKPTFGVDVKPPPTLSDTTENYFRSRSQTGSGVKRRRRRSSEYRGMASEKRIKQENTTDSHLCGSSAGAPSHVTVTSPRLATSTRASGGPGALSLPVTISKDFIKELVVSRALAKDGPAAAGRGRGDGGVGSRDSASACSGPTFSQP